VRAMIFSKFGIYFTFPHFTDQSKLIVRLIKSISLIARFASDRLIILLYKTCVHLERKSIQIGIPIHEITEVKMFVDLGALKCSIFVRTRKNCSAWIRRILGMSNSEENKGHFSSTSKCKLQFTHYNSN